MNHTEDNLKREQCCTSREMTMKERLEYKIDSLLQEVESCRKLVKELDRNPVMEISLKNFERIKLLY